MKCFSGLLSLLFSLCCSGSLLAQTVSPYIVTDQFGYLPSSVKVAVIRDPKTGFDAAESFTPGNSYAVVNTATSAEVFSGAPVVWNNGTEDVSSGDKAWWFDFSSVTAAGKYYVLDKSNNVRSFEFEISDDIYREVLKHAVRTFFYQRAGHEKAAAFAGAAWADGASHIKASQDKNARQYNRTNDATTARDVSGGWYDAGDYNKYTTWTANYVVDFMRAYLEAPGAWGDDYNIPESGNHIPDILDEAKWGIDHLLRMQNPNGSVLSIVGLSHASPPSAATGPSLYGTASTSATLNTAAAFAIASKVFASRGMNAYATQLRDAAIRAWDWAVANPSVIFRNNDAAAGTSGLGAGQQEVDDYGRFVARMEAAVFLFDLTGEARFREYFDANYTRIHLMEWSYAYPFETANQEILLHYTKLPNATAGVVSAIRTTYRDAMNGGDNFGAYTGSKDPYRAYIKDYTWGSNSTKGSQGLMYMDMITYGIDAAKNDEAKKAALGFIHNLHGVNPLSFVYLSNMYTYGAEKGVNEFYHTWFGNGSAKWDRVGVSTYGPAPGFLTGGPNPSYDRDGCCATNSCGNSNALCNSETLVPPKGQPAQKSYKDFNTSWPLNSWSVTENSNGYQLNYIRLLSHFVPATYDCSGKINGTATYDVCNRCSGGSTGITPITDANQCAEPVTGLAEESNDGFSVSPNPTKGTITVAAAGDTDYQFSLMDSKGINLTTQSGRGEALVNLTAYPAGIYFLKLVRGNRITMIKVSKI